MNRYKVGITEKRLNHKRFRKTEDAILRVFFEKKKNITVMEMAKKVGVARSTVYEHHIVIRDIVSDYRKYVLGKYNRLMTAVLKKKGLTIRDLYLQVLLFVIRNKALFNIVVKENSREVYIRMIEKMRPALVKLMGLPENYKMVYKIYANEVVTLFERWGEDGFKDNELEDVLKDIIYLTDTARSRLVKIENN